MLTLAAILNNFYAMVTLLVTLLVTLPVTLPVTLLDNVIVKHYKTHFTRRKMKNAKNNTQQRILSTISLRSRKSYQSIILYKLFWINFGYNIWIVCFSKDQIGDYPNTCKGKGEEGGGRALFGSRSRSQG